MQPPCTDAELTAMNAWWRAANYLSVGQVYLRANPLLRQPLARADVKTRLLGHFGTVPGLNFLYVHLNRIIRQRDLDMIFIAGPGHGAPGVVANAYLEGSYTETYPDISRDAAGMHRLFRQFSWPGGIPSHASPDTPGSIHEGGELGYSLAHAYGAVFDNPNLIAACLIGDGEAETGPLATAWHSNKFLDPAHDGAVLPVLHLNGYKIANPTISARIPPAELDQLIRGYGYTPHLVSGDDPVTLHRTMADTLDRVFDEIRAIQSQARSAASPAARPAWPMIIMQTPKGWTGPKEVDGKKVEGFWRAHQVPLPDVATDAHLAILDDWLRSYAPNELFDPSGTLRPEIAGLAPAGDRRMSANPNANGGRKLIPLRLPDIAAYAVNVPSPGDSQAEATRNLGRYLAEVMRGSEAQRNFRLFGPDETESNRLTAVLDASPRAWTAETVPYDTWLARGGRVMEILSEHTCQGWLEGYLLTGRHGFFSCYEAFVHVVDSMFNQHAKWLESSRKIPWRQPIASLTYLLTSHVWQQDHNGFSHQDPGFIDVVVNKKPETINVYLPPDANTLLCVTEHCLESRDQVNVIVAGKAPAPQFLDMPAAIRHTADGIGVFEWASTPGAAEPDVVLGCCGDVPTLEAVAAAGLLRQLLPELRVRVVNVVDLMRLASPKQHPHGMPDAAFDVLFTRTRPIVFAYHGYPWLIHRLTYKRTGHDNIAVRGFEEEGSTTTPFDMAVRNHLDRFHLALDVIERVPGLGAGAAVSQIIRGYLTDHGRYIRAFGEDMPMIRNWRWSGEAG